MTAAITAMGFAHPKAVPQSDMWSAFFEQHYDRSPLAKRLFANSGVTTRHAVLDPRTEDGSSWSTEKRMQRFLPEALPLAVSAVEDALTASGLSPDDVGLLVIASCTGYVSPGLDTAVADATGMASEVRRLSIGHMGCYAAVPALSSASDYVRANGRPAVVVNVELTSLHIQPPTRDPEQMVAHALFSDAVSAMVVQPDAAGLEIIDVVSATDLDNGELMTWQVTDLGFRMGLSAKIPDAIEHQVRPLVERLLAPHYLTVDDVDGWAVHPGGPRILDVTERTMKLDDHALAVSRRVLSEHGNCSSATLPMVIDGVQRAGGRIVVAMAFGPGLTLTAALLRLSD